MGMLFGIKDVDQTHNTRNVGFWGFFSVILTMKCGRHSKVDD